jgi:hypothetical protein
MQVLGAAASRAIDEGTLVELNGIFNDPDIGNGNDVTYSWLVTGANGEPLTFVDSGDQPNASFTPLDNGRYIAELTVTADEGTFTHRRDIFVNNTTPVVYFGPDNNLTHGIPFYLDANDFHTDDDNTADTFTYQWSIGSNNGQDLSGVVLNQQTLNFTPYYVGDYMVTLTVTDDDGAQSNTGELDIFVRNTAPVAVPQALILDEDQELIVTLTGTDINGDDLSFSIITGPQNGTLSDIDPATHNVTYTPTPDYNGQDSFVFHVDDGNLGTSEATINLDILPVNDVPVAVPQALTLDEDQELIITLTGTDVDGDNLSFSIITGPQNGTLSDIDHDTHNITYNPDPDYNGPDSFVFRVDDGNLGRSEAAISLDILPVNDAPEAGNMAVDMDEDQPTLIYLNGTDIETARHELVYTLVSNPLNGGLSFGQTGTWTYTPDDNFFGTDHFTYTVTDTGDPAGVQGNAITTGEIVVDININPVNDAPVAYLQNLTINENQEIIITLMGYDVDGDDLEYRITENPEHGTLSDIDPDTHNVTYTPDPDYNGQDSFMFRVDDGSLGVSEALISLDVQRINVFPVADPQGLSLDEDSDLVIPLSGTDVDGDELTFSIITDPEHGTLGAIDPVTNQVTYTPDPDYNGQDSFMFRVDDGNLGTGEAAISLDILPVNDAPVAVPQALTVGEDQELIITLTGTDIDGDGLSFSIITGPQNGTLSDMDHDNHNVTYTPDPGYIGPDSFMFRVDDGNLVVNEALISLDVRALSNNYGGTFGARGRVFDADGVTPLPGTGLSDMDSADPDQLYGYIQSIYAGADGTIDLPTADGSVTGDDVLLSVVESPGRFFTAVGEGFPFNPQGRFFEDFTHSLNAGAMIYCRAWNNTTPVTSIRYGDSALYTLADGNIDENDFGTWSTDSTALNFSITNITQDWAVTDDITITWESKSGMVYEIYSKDDYDGTFSVVDTVTASGGSTSWTDDGSQAGVVHPSAVQQRYYKIIQGGADSENIVGMYEITVNEGMNLISLPLVPFSTSLADVIGSQVTGADNEGGSDRLWVWNGTNYEFAWQVDGVGPDYDGQWYTGNELTTITLDADQGAWLQIRPGNGTVDLCFLGEIYDSDRIIPIRTGMNLIGTSYPVPVPLAETNLWESGLSGADNEGDADRIWSWDSNHYEFSWLVDGVGEPHDGQWYMGNDPVDSSLEPGRGYWLQRREGHPAFDWNYHNQYNTTEEEGEVNNLLLAGVDDDFELFSKAGSTLTDEGLAPIIEEVIGVWADLLYLDTSTLAELNNLNYEIVDLPGLTLGQVVGTTVFIDKDAAGYGWFIDTTPDDDKEFEKKNGRSEVVATRSSTAYGNMDLLTVAMHEIGHALGLGHDNTEWNDIMRETLYAGTRIVPTGRKGIGSEAEDYNNNNRLKEAIVMVFDEERGELNRLERYREHARIDSDYERLDLSVWEGAGVRTGDEDEDWIVEV